MISQIFKKSGRRGRQPWRPVEIWCIFRAAGVVSPYTLWWIFKPNECSLRYMRSVKFCSCFGGTDAVINCKCKQFVNNLKLPLKFKRFSWKNRDLQLYMEGVLQNRTVETASPCTAKSQKENRPKAYRSVVNEILQAMWNNMLKQIVKYLALLEMKLN